MGTHLVCKERFDIDEVPPRQWMLQGFDARVWITRLLTNLCSLIRNVNVSVKKDKIVRATYLQVDSLLSHRLDGLKVHAMRQHQLLIHRPVGVEDDHHVGQRVVALLLWKQKIEFNVRGSITCCCISTCSTSTVS